MPSEMQTRIARAVYESRNGSGCVPWSRRPLAHRAPYLADAAAVLKELRKPTTRMIDAGMNAVEPEYGMYALGRGDAAIVWTAMLDAEIVAAGDSHE